MPRVSSTVNGEIRVGPDGQIQAGMLVIGDGFVCAGVPFGLAIKAALTRARLQMDGKRDDLSREVEVEISMIVAADLPNAAAEASSAGAAEVQADTAGTTPPGDQQKPICPHCQRATGMTYEKDGEYREFHYHCPVCQFDMLIIE
ncbi:MAG: hypothetical protein V1856_03035 [Candidatus Liptonbacteria bacterium]